jgi:hypothetical protein
MACFTFAPDMAEANGTNATKLPQAPQSVQRWVEERV